MTCQWHKNTEFEKSDRRGRDLNKEILISTFYVYHHAFLSKRNFRWIHKLKPMLLKLEIVSLWRMLSRLVSSRIIWPLKKFSSSLSLQSCSVCLESRIEGQLEIFWKKKTADQFSQSRLNGLPPKTSNLKDKWEMGILSPETKDLSKFKV